jgi:signal transduction histidine kinase
MGPAVRVLIVEDSEDDAMLMARVLAREGLAIDFKRVETTAALAHALVDEPWDLVLVDWKLPGFDGWQALALIKASGKDIPFIIVSGVIGEETAVAAMKAGAHDFVRKERLARLVPVVERELADAAVRRAKVEAEAALRRSLCELAEANHCLQEADRHKDEFLGVISHELRTPLNFITGFASLLADEVPGPVNDGQRTYVGKILAGSERMLLLVNDLLDMSRIQAGRLAIERDEVDVGAIVLDVIHSLSPLGDEKGLALSHDLQIPVAAYLDGARLFQVFSNLLGNAIKFTPEGGRVHVSGRLDGGHVFVAVADTGPGIAEADRPRLFKPFSQLDMSATRHARGAGLGLSICQALVTAQGGTIDVSSRVGEGSTFMVRLPIGQPAHAEAEPAGGTAAQA